MAITQEVYTLGTASAQILAPSADAQRVTISNLQPDSIDGGDVYRVPLANVDLDAANLTELEKKSGIVQRLVFSGFDPAAILAALELPPIPHTGLPTTQLQPISQIDPEDPKAAYPVDGEA